MDPISAAGIALSVAGLAGQVFSGCIQGIQFIVTARGLPEDSKYLNLRLRMEQQRLFAWSETSGLLDLENANELKIRHSRTWILHRNTILDLLVQIQCLFKEFADTQKKNPYLKVAPESFESDEELTQEDPAKDSSSAHVPLTESRRKFIIKAMKALSTNAKENILEGHRRLRWASFDKNAFEVLLQRFSTLNDNMTDILDTQLQTEIHRTTQDTNRGVLQLHKDLTSLRRLVMALDIKMQAQSHQLPISQYTPSNDATGLQLLTQLAKFKAFNKSMETESTSPWDEATAMVLDLGTPNGEKKSTRIEPWRIKLSDKNGAETEIRCEATLLHDNKPDQSVWIEWKDYDFQKPGSPTSPPQLLIDRVEKLAALLHHTPKTEAFRVPHCLGYFSSSSIPSPSSSPSNDTSDPRIGFVFEKPLFSQLTAPISLHTLLSLPKPRVTERIRLAHAIANCLLYLHSVNWLHKGLRSHNIVFFPLKTGTIDYAKPYLSGFDFARPARADDWTEVPGDNPEYNLYRHPSTQSLGFGPRESFRKSFDIYSLGVVLVELAHWKTIDRVLGIEVGKVRLAGKIREMLLDEERVRGVGAEMGEVFEEATRRCVAGGRELGVEEMEDEGIDAVAARLGMAFYEDVVKKLGDVRV